MFFEVDSSTERFNINVMPTLIVDGAWYIGEFSVERISEYLDGTISRKIGKN